MSKSPRPSDTTPVANKHTAIGVALNLLLLCMIAYGVLAVRGLQVGLGPSRDPNRGGNPPIRVAPREHPLMKSLVIAQQDVSHGTAFDAARSKLKVLLRP